MGGLSARAGEALKKATPRAGGAAWAPNASTSKRRLESSAIGRHRSHEAHASVPAASVAASVVATRLHVHRMHRAVGRHRGDGRSREAAGRHLHAHHVAGPTAQRQHQDHEQDEQAFHAAMIGVGRTPRG